MFYSKETFNLRKKTSSDILDDEQGENDEVATSSSLKKDGKTSYKEKNEQFLTNMKENEKLSDINEIKNRQMQNFASTSSEYYTMPAKNSVLIYVLLGIFSLLFLATMGVFLFFNFSQYKVVSYEYNDMKPEFSQGTIFLLDRQAVISENSIGTYIYFKNAGGRDILRKIVGVDRLVDFEIDISTLQEEATPEPFDINNQNIYGLVSQTFGSTGVVVYVLGNYGYIPAGVFFVVVIALLIVRGISSKKASDKFMERMDWERVSLEKRRKQLSEGVLQMQSGDVDNMEILSDLLNVSSAVPGDEKRLEKINRQLQERQLKQVEKIKKGDEITPKESIEKKKENDVISFVRNEIEKQEQNSGLSEEEIEKRLKDAENTNKNI